MQDLSQLELNGCDEPDGTNMRTSILGQGILLLCSELPFAS